MTSAFYPLLVFLPVCIIHTYHLWKRAVRGKDCALYLSWFVLSIMIEPFSAAFIIYSQGNLIPPNIDPELRVINDVIQHNIPFTPDLFYYYCDPMAALAIGFILLVCYRSVEYRERALFTLGSSFILRDLTIVLTQLPLTQLDIATNSCLEYSTLTFTEILLKHTLLGFACGDYNYSGHTIIFTTALWGLGVIFNECRHRRSSILMMVFGILTYISCTLALVISRAHYSIDVIESLFITSTFYYFISPKVVNYFGRT